MSEANVAIVNETDTDVDTSHWPGVLTQIARDRGFDKLDLSVAIVDDPAIHRLNREYLDHDYPTDVLSFPLESNTESGKLEGEIIVSVDTAKHAARELNARWEDELLLYVIHGALHLVGFDDHDPDLVSEMRAAEQQYMRLAGVNAHPTVNAQDATE